MLAQLGFASGLVSYFGLLINPVFITIEYIYEEVLQSGHQVSRLGSSPGAQSIHRLHELGNTPT